MSEEKAFRDLLYDVVKEADPVLYEAIGDALSPYLDVELVINLVASYTITMRRTYLSCAMKPSTSNTTETTEKYADAHIGGSILCRRLCVLVDDLVETEVKQVYLKVVHNDVKPLRCKVEPKLVGYSTKKCKLWLTRPDFLNMKSFNLEGRALVIEAPGTSIMKAERLPFGPIVHYPFHEVLSEDPGPDSLELWLSCMDPSMISIEVVLVHEVRDLDPLYRQQDSIAGLKENGELQEATRDMILNQCSDPVDLASIQHGEEVKSAHPAPPLELHYPYGTRVERGTYFTMVKHLKNPRWKWVEEVAEMIYVHRPFVDCDFVYNKCQEGGGDGRDPCVTT